MKLDNPAHGYDAHIYPISSNRPGMLVIERGWAGAHTLSKVREAGYEVVTIAVAEHTDETTVHFK